MSSNLKGHMGLKSSPLATTSCKLTKQFLVLQQINAHHKNLSNVKSSIDTTCPKSWYKHINVKDQIRREESARNNNKSRPTSAKSQDIYLQTMESPISENRTQSVYQTPMSERNIRDKPNDLTLDIEKEDIIDKNCKKFTDQKSFTPRILKNEKSSKLTQLRCYNPPKRKSKEKKTEFNTMTEDNSIIISEKVQSEQQLPEQNISTEEIHLREIDFLKDLTDDILLKHQFTDREVEQICENHIRKNKCGLEVDQMRKLCSFVVNNTKDIPYPLLETNKPQTVEYEDIERDYFHSVEHNIGQQILLFEESTAPSRLQISLRSNDDSESIQHQYIDDHVLTGNKSFPLHSENEMENICETLKNTQVKETNPDLNATFDTDETIKNVHFASQNETYSAQEIDQSLTDVSPIQVENSYDSTSLSLSLELNKTIKTDKMEDYDDDFDN